LSIKGALLVLVGVEIALVVVFLGLEVSLLTSFR